MTTELAREAKLDLFAFATGEQAVEWAFGSTERRAVAVFEEPAGRHCLFLVACRPKPAGVKFHDRIAPEFRTAESDVEFERRLRG